MGDTELFYHKRLEPARKLYEAALPLWQGLADKMVAFPDGDPALPELERISLIDAEEAVADTCDRLGIVSLRFDFDYARAEEWFTQSLEIRKRHVEKDPVTRTVWRAPLTSTWPSWPCNTMNPTRR